MGLIDLSLDQISDIHQLTSMSTSVRLFSVSFFSFSLSSSSVFLLLLPLVSESVPRIYRDREKKSNTKNVQRKKMRKSQSNIKKKETQLKEKDEQWNARENRERTWVLRYSGRNTFLRKGLSFTCPTCNLISVASDVPFDAILNKDINNSMQFRMTLLHHTPAFSIHCVISLNLSNLMKHSIIFIPS